MGRSPLGRLSAIPLIALIILPLLPASPAHAEWHPLIAVSGEAAPSVTLISASPRAVTLEVTVPGFTSEAVTLGGVEYRRISLPGADRTIEVGRPEVPEIRAWIAIPERATVSVRVVSEERVVIPGFIVSPRQPPTTDGSAAGGAPAPDAPVPGGAPARDEAFYAGGEISPPGIAVAGEAVGWRDLHVAGLAVRPLRYDAATHSLIAASRLRIEARWEGRDLTRAAVSPGRSITPDWDRRYRAAVINYPSLGLPVARATTPGCDLIILAADALADSVEALARWHRREGIGTEVVRLSGVGSTPDQVKTYLHTRYDQDHMSAVLLAGDISLLPIGVVATTMDSRTPSDHWYACLDGGGDYLPEFDIARLSATTGAGLANQVRKILSYEVTPAAGDWLTRSILCANERSDYIQCKQNIAAYPYHGEPAPTFETCYAGMGGSRPQLVQAIERGLNLVNYRGHGLASSWWWSVGWNVNDIHALENGDKYCLVFNICCENAWLDSLQETVAEAWLSSDHAAAGALGATRDSWTEPNHVFDKALYAAIFDSSFCGTMEAVNSAKLRVSGDGLGRDNNWMYVWLGDPVMQIWTRSPEALSVIHPPLAWPAMPAFRVDVASGGGPLAGARVCLRSRSGELYTVETTGADGSATFALGSFTVPDSLDVTVTGHNGRPYLATIPTGFTGPHLECLGEIPDDDAAGGSAGDGDGAVDAGERVELGITLQNIGSETAPSCAIDLATTSPWVAISDGHEALGDIASMETRAAPGAFVIETAAGAPDGTAAAFTLTMTSGAATWTEIFEVPLHAAVVSVAGCRVIDSTGGDGDGMAEPGESVSLEFTLANTGSADLRSLSARLASTTGLATLTGDSAGAPSLAPGGTMVLAPAFAVAIAPDARIPSAAPLTLAMSAAWGFGLVMELPLPIGPFRDDVEHGTGLWTHAVATPGFVDQWSRTTLANHTPGGHWSWKFGNAVMERYADRSDGALVAPSLPVGPGSRLVFWHQIEAETSATAPGVAFDGGVIEISVAGGAWQPLTPAGGYPFVTAVATPPSPFAAGTPCFSGKHEWRAEAVDLSGFSGEARIRFRFGSDGAVGRDGWCIDDVEISGPVSTDVAGGQPGGAPPWAFDLAVNRPNPVDARNAGTVIEYSLPSAGEMELAVFDVAGRMVRVLEKGVRAAGAHAARWDGRDESGRLAAPGMYFYRLTAGGGQAARAMIVLR